MNANTEKLTHPMDGKFYLTLDMLCTAEACSDGRTAFTETARAFHGQDVDDYTRIPITLDFMREGLKRYESAGAVCFLLETIAADDRLSWHRARGIFDMSWGEDSDGTFTTAAVFFMDALEHVTPKGDA